MSPSRAHRHHHRGCGCGHAHGPTLSDAQSLTSARDMAALIASIPIRSCTAAIFLLVIAARFEVFAVGVMAVVAMGFGTASFNLLVEGSGIAARGLAALGQTASRDAAGRLSARLHLIGGGIIMVFSLILLRPYFGDRLPPAEKCNGSSHDASAPPSTPGWEGPQTFLASRAICWRSSSLSLRIARSGQPLDVFNARVHVRFADFGDQGSIASLSQSRNSSGRRSNAAIGSECRRRRRVVFPEFRLMVSLPHDDDQTRRDGRLRAAVPAPSRSGRAGSCGTFLERRCAPDRS